MNGTVFTIFAIYKTKLRLWVSNAFHFQYKHYVVRQINLTSISDLPPQYSLYTQKEFPKGDSEINLWNLHIVIYQHYPRNTFLTILYLAMWIIYLRMYIFLDFL